MSSGPGESTTERGFGEAARFWQGADEPAGWAFERAEASPEAPPEVLEILQFAAFLRARRRRGLRLAAGLRLVGACDVATAGDAQCVAEYQSELMPSCSARRFELRERKVQPERNYMRVARSECGS